MEVTRLKIGAEDTQGRMWNEISARISWKICARVVQKLRRKREIRRKVVDFTVVV